MRFIFSTLFVSFYNTMLSSGAGFETNGFTLHTQFEQRARQNDGSSLLL